MNDYIESHFIEVSTKSRNMVCGSIYCPPNCNVEEFQKEMNNLMGKIKLGTHNYIVIGMDHNLDFLKCSLHTGTENIISSILDNSLFPCITKPTRVIKTMATLIDNILINSRLYGRHRCAVLLTDIGDHFLSLPILEGVKLCKREAKKLITREFTDCKLEALENDLGKVDWSPLLLDNNVNVDYRTFAQKLSLYIDKHIPEKIIDIPAKQFLCEHWMSKGLLRCNKKCQKLYEVSFKSRNNESREKYKNCRALLQKIKRRAKPIYQNQCMKFKNNTKNLWKTINNVIKTAHDRTCIIDEIKVDNVAITEAKQITHEFGKYFAE